MGRMRPAGLVKRGDIWHIDKRIGGRRLCESTGETELDKAELYLAMRIERARRASIYGERPKRTFRDAVKRYLRENQHKRSIDDDELHLKQLDPLIGNLDLRMVHMGTLQPFIAKRQRQRDVDGFGLLPLALTLRDEGLQRPHVNHAEIEVPDERVELLQVQLVVVNAPFVLVLAEIPLDRVPKRPLGSFAVDRRPAGPLYPHGQVELRLIKLRLSCALAQASASYPLVDVPDIAAFDESGRSHSSHGFLLRAVGRPLRDL